MRILITSEGENTIRELEDTQIKHRNKTFSYGKSFRRTFTVERSTKREHYPDISSMRKTSRTIYSSIKTDSSKSSKHPKKIHLKLTKLYIPKQISDEYEKEKKTSDVIIDDQLSTPEIQKLKQSHNHYHKYTLGEILGKKSVIGLKKKLIEEERMKDKLSKIDETKFRSDYQNFTKLEKLEQILDYQKINPENNNLIRFINENKDIHKISLKKIVQFDKNKLFKANKICQTVLYNNKQNKLLQERIKTFLQGKHAQEKISFDRNLRSLKTEIDESVNIFNQYSNTLPSSEKYKEIHIDFQKKYWNKTGLQKLCRPRINPKTLSQTE